MDKKIKDLEINSVYSNLDVVEAFGCALKAE